LPRLREFRWDSWADWAAQNARGDLAIDTETSGVGFYDEPFCATVTWRDADGGLQSAYISLEGEGRERRIGVLREILRYADRWIFHNAKFDLQKLELVGVLSEGWNGRLIEDTATIYALLDENDRKGLKYLAEKILGESTNEDKALAAVRRKLKLKKADGYQHIPREFIVPYALKDTEFTLRLFERLWPKLETRDLMELYRSEIDLTLALLEIEAQGFALDVPYLEATASEYGARVMKGWRQIVKLTGNEELNPNSPAQIAAAFEARGIRLESTAKAELSKLDDELATSLLQYRSDSKLHKTYLTAMLADQRGGLIHPNFNTTLPRTGRMSSSAASNN